MSHPSNEPILPGDDATDYERYLRTGELLALQRTPEQMAHRDEMLFQTIHQASELWLKLACFEAEAAAVALDKGDVWAAVRVLRRATGALDAVHGNTVMLEHIAPCDYHHLRPALGHGSGFDSPGFRRLHEVSPKLGEAFSRLLVRRNLGLVQLYRESSRHEDVFQTAERMIDWDEKLILWRTLHMKVVERIIGGHATGTQGTPVDVLLRRVDIRCFPELWEVRNSLTRLHGGA